MKKTVCLAICFSILLTITIHADELRTWTSSTGQKMEAELIDTSEDGKSVTLRRNDGKEGNVALDKLSSADKSYVTRLKRALDKAKEEEKKAEEERKAWQVAVDLDEELKKSGLTNLFELALFGNVKLVEDFEKADAFDRPQIKVKIDSERVKIAQKTFVTESTYSAIDVKVNGNRSSTILSIPLGHGFKISNIGAISLPISNVTGNVTDMKINYMLPMASSEYRGRSFPREMVKDIASPSLPLSPRIHFPVSGNTDSIKEIVRNSNNYQVRILFKILYNKEGMKTRVTTEILKIEIIKVK